MYGGFSSLFLFANLKFCISHHARMNHSHSNMRRFYATLIGCLSLGQGSSLENVVKVDISDTPPADASSVIDPSFAGFGIEPSNLFSFTGMEQPNELTFNLINNLVAYTGKPPHIRLGGNTEDYMVYHKDMTQWTWINNPDPIGQGAFPADHMLVGPRFFEAANRFPKGTPVTWGLNLAYQEDDWQDQIVTMAQQVIENCPNLKLVSFEIGNEPDLYLRNRFRSGTWSGHTYAQQWLERAAVVYEQVLKPKNITSAFFEPGCTASTIGTDLRIQDLTAFGMDQKAPDSSRSYIASWNQHDYYYYIGVSTYTLTLSHFMQLSTTEDQLSAWTGQIDQAHATPYPYALREMGVVGPIGLEGITNTFGAALWTLNFLLYTATLNITSVQFHMTDDSNASAWQPIEMYGRRPFVRPLYYGHAAFDQIIGPTCTARVARVQLQGGMPQGYDGYVRAYAVYQAGVWENLVVINSKPTDGGGSIPSLSVELALPTDLAGQTVYMSYLSNAASGSTAGTTWNGVEYESSGDGTSTAKDDGMSGKTVQVRDDGTLTINVRDSQAFVANLGHRVGEGLQADQVACAAIAHRSPSTDGGGDGGSGGSGGSRLSSGAGSVMSGGSSTGSGGSSTSGGSNDGSGGSSANNNAGGEIKANHVTSAKRESFAMTCCWTTLICVGVGMMLAM